MTCKNYGFAKQKDLEKSFTPMTFLSKSLITISFFPRFCTHLLV